MTQTQTHHTTIRKSVQSFIIQTFRTLTGTLGTVERSLDIANHYVEENHKKITKKTTVSAQINVAEFQDDIAARLDASASLKAQYDEVVANW